MEFAECLSTNPSRALIPTLDEDKNVVINNINDIKHALLRNNLSPRRTMQAIEMNKIREYNDIINDNPARNINLNAFNHLQPFN